MSREIKFRGRSIRTGKFVCSPDILRRQDWDKQTGWTKRTFLQDGYSCNVTPKIHNFEEVDDKTVGEFTG